MRIPIIIACLALLLILAPACESTGGTTPSKSGDSSASREPSEPTAPTKGVTGKPIRLEWRNLNPRHGDQVMGVINRSSPDLALLYRRKDKFRNVKPVEDDMMAHMLAAVRDTDFFELAAKGTTPDRYKMGDGHGVVWVQIGDESWTLFFCPATGQADRALPRTYRDIKVLILRVWNETLWFSTTTSGGEGAFRIDPHKHGKPQK